MKMNFAKLAFSAVVVVGLSAFAADDKKQARKIASKVQCVELNVPFDTFGMEQYTLEEVQALRNSVFAQYGYKFTNPSILAEMKARGCYKEGEYKYSNLTKIDKQNVKQFKAYEASMKETDAESFAQAWAKAKAEGRKELLKYVYCHLSDTSNKFIGTIHFSPSRKAQNHELSGLFNLKGLKYEDQEGRKHVLDAKALRSLDSTSMQSIELPAKGSWNVNNSGDVEISIAGATKGTEAKKITIDSEYFEMTQVLGCKIAK